MSSYYPAPEITERLCNGCDQIKPMRKRKQRCDDCSGVQQTEPPASIEQEPEQVPHELLLERPPSLGFNLVLQEGDFVLEQHTDERGTQTIWLSRDEACDMAQKIFAVRDRREVVLTGVPSIADLEAA